MTAIAVICGAAFGFGLVLIFAGWRGVVFTSPFSPEQALARLGLRLRSLAIAVFVGIFVALLTGWPIAGVLAGGFSLVAPYLLGGKTNVAANVEQTEAIATWVEMLRDTMAGAAGIEGAIIATASAAPASIREEVIRLASRLGRHSLSESLGRLLMS